MHGYSQSLSVDVLHSFLLQLLNILDIIDISIGQISILLHYAALQIPTLPPTHSTSSPYAQPFNQLHNIFHQVYCLSPPPQLPILTFITLQDLQSSTPEPADRAPLIEMFDVVSHTQPVILRSMGEALGIIQQQTGITPRLSVISIMEPRKGGGFLAPH